MLTSGCKGILIDLIDNYLLSSFVSLLINLFATIELNKKLLFRCEMLFGSNCILGEILSHA